MIYGYIKQNSTEYVEDPYAIESVVYNEYCNYKSLLESCIDETTKPILEAKVRVLYEVSIKDIIDTIVKAYYKFKDWLYEVLTKLVDKILPDKNERMKKLKEKVKLFLKNLAHDPMRNAVEVTKAFEDLKKMELYRYTIAVDGTSDEHGVSSKPIYLSASKGKLKENVQSFMMKYMNDFTRLQSKVMQNPNKNEYTDSESEKFNNELANAEFSIHKDPYTNYHNFNITNPDKFIQDTLEDFDTYDECKDTLKWMDGFIDPIKNMCKEIEGLIKTAESGKEKSSETGMVVYKGNDIPVNDYAGILRFEMRYLSNIAKTFVEFNSKINTLQNNNKIQYGKIILSVNAISNKLHANTHSDSDYEYGEA